MKKGNSLDQIYMFGAETEYNSNIVFPDEYKKGFSRDTETKVYGFDLETEGLHYQIPYRNIICFALALGKNRVDLSWQLNKLDINAEKDLTKMLLILSDPEAILVGHNIKYDINWMRYKYKCAINCQVFDTYVAATLINENREKNNLEVIANEFLNDPLFEAYKQQVDRTRLLNHEKDTVLVYNGKDSDASRQLFAPLVQKLNRIQMLPLMQTQMEVLKVLSKMETTGVYIDLDWKVKQENKLFNRLVENRNKLQDKIGMRFDPNKQQELHNVLYNVLKLKSEVITNSGEEATGFEAISDMKREGLHLETLDTILQYKKDIKVLTSFYNPVDKWIKGDGRVHGNYRIGKAKTHRLTCENPNLMQVPRDKDVKGMYAVTPGWSYWFSGDFCVGLSTKILTSNLQWKCAKDLQVGEELIGFEEYQDRSKPRRFKPSIIESKSIKTLQSVSIKTDKGQIEVSLRHKFLVVRGYNNGGYLYKWITADCIKLGDQIGFTQSPWEESKSYEAGYLAGFFDGGRVGSKYSKPATVIGWELIGEKENVCFSTSTKTFIANGFLSHNSQNELRCAAELSKEPVMIEAFEIDHDIHTAVMADLKGLEYNELQSILNTKSSPLYSIYKNERVAIKRVNFGILFGIAAPRLRGILWNELGIDYTLEYCEQLIKDWLDRYQNVKRWIKDTERFILKHGFVRMPLGAVRRLVGADYGSGEGRRELRQGVNFPIQAYSGLITQVGMIVLDQLLNNLTQEARILLQTHDSIDGEINLSRESNPEQTMRELIPEIKEVMERDTKKYLLEVFNVDFSVPLKFDIDFSIRWS